MASYIYGIDFGTSNSVLAALDKDTKQIVRVTSESSLIYFQDADRIFLGDQAIKNYISNNMSGRLLKSVKTLLPQSSFTFTYIYGNKYTAEDLVCLILKYLKDQTDEYLGQDVTEVVIGRPVVFSNDAVKDKLAETRLLKAAKKAGFQNIWLQYEPIAAGYLYEQTIVKPELVLIGDFGGGTSDFTLMQLDKTRINSKNRRADIIKTGGVHIGGDDFDAKIMWNKLVQHFGYGLQYDSYGKKLDLPVHIFRTLCEWERMAFLKEGSIRRQLDNYYLYTNRHPALQRLMNLIDFNLGFSVFQSIEKAKITLSQKNSAEIIFRENHISIEESLAISDFNNYIQPEINETENYLLQFMSEAGVNPDNIDNIFLTGGTSSLPGILTIFEKIFPKEKINRGDNFNSVAQGLALSYFYLNEQE